MIKLFADGVMEGNPYATPPTLPTPLMLHAYRQPIFGKDKSGKSTVTGYVDTDSEVCKDVRGNPGNYADSRRWRGSSPRIVIIRDSAQFRTAGCSTIAISSWNS